MKSILIASTSTVHGSGYLEYLLEELKVHFKSADEILFIPYARPVGISHDSYTKIAAKAFKSIGKTVKGLHEYKYPKKAIESAQGIFTGGGNTFVLVNQLYKNDILVSIKESIAKGIPYLGTSAGSNICGLTINTTNDMPIVYPPSFKTLGLVPFNINPHYLDPNPNSTHMGETRETRIKEFHAFNTQPVVGLREGSWIEVNRNSLTLKGKLDARIFEYNKAPYELQTNSDLGFLK
ncbi:dipeptidase PepE [uncultured Winogradskyella sp.]|uniref:dipeptidase PepE n=1 Tax=uncultured Winogradskyella sp. TaxID=395353 RepID=UPI0026131248|nr:dipeptidase PepE [uncultured Winogradskyella sp.]